MTRGPMLGPILLSYVIVALVISSLPTDVAAMKSPPDGYTQELRVTEDAEASYFPTIVIDEQDNVHMFWLNGTGRDLDNRKVNDGQIFYAKYSPYGELLVPPRMPLAIPGSGFVTTPPSVAIAFNGVMFVAWSDSHTGVATIYLMSMDLDGNVKGFINGLTDSTDAMYPDLAVDREGNVHLAWSQYEMFGSSSTWPDVYYMKVAQDGTTIIPRVTVTSTYLATNHPTLAVDDALNAHMIYEENVNLPGYTDELYYSVVDSQGNITLDLQRVTATNPGSFRPDLAIDKDGTRHVVWVENNKEMSVEIFYTRFLDTSDIDIMRISSSSEKSYDPRVVVDKGTNAHIVWSENIYGGPIDNSRVRFAVIDNLWNIIEGPMDLTYGGLGAKAPVIALDGFGNQIVAWDDYRADEELESEVWDIYYMRTVEGVNLEPTDVLEINGVPAGQATIQAYVGDEVVLFAGNSTDPNSWDNALEYNFTVVHNNKTFYTEWDDNATLNLRFDEVGDYVVYVKVRDSFGYKNSRPQAVLFRVIEKRPSQPTVLLDNPRVRTTLIAGSIGITATLGYLIGGTEMGKYKLATLLLVPLYSRIKRENTLDNYIRGQIHGYILAKPGCHYNQIKQTLNLNNGTLAYHLRKLEREEFIKSVRDGMYKRFYPVGLKIPKREIKLSAMQDTILDIIKHHPGISQKEVAKAVGISAPAVIYHIGVLAGAKLVLCEKKGSRMEYRAIERPEEEWEVGEPDVAPSGSGQ